MQLFKRGAFVPTIVVLVAITYLSLAQDPVHTQGLHLFEGADKVVHGCMYLALVVVGSYDLYRVGRPSVRGRLGWMVVAVMWGGVMELLQGAMGLDRSADWLDFAANSCGALLGFLLSLYVLPRLWMRWHSRR